MFNSHGRTAMLDRFTDRTHCGTIFDGFKRMDPGQALCRELYGRDWMKSEQFATDNAADEPTAEILAAAVSWWVNGVWPQWASAVGYDSGDPDAPRVFEDGNQWCALHGPNIQEGHAAFGATVEDALAAYRALETRQV
jgi:hypothetical protein